VTIRKCPLCLQTKKIITSHLIPRAIYESCSTKDLDPVVITSDAIRHTSRQLQHPLLCSGCDNSLNRKGEDWLLPLLATDDGQFRFYDLLSAVPADIEDAGSRVRVYGAARNQRIKINKLAHFALGIFWKASIHSWRGKEREPLIRLGTYREPLRVFLRGEAGFPQEMALVVFVLPPPVTQISSCVPSLTSKTDCHHYAFYVPGIQFLLLVGKQIPRADRRLCFVSNPLHPMIVSDFSASLLDHQRTLAASAKMSRRIIARCRN
jgi:hypothetical protein